MADQLLTLLKNHFLKKEVGDRARTISEWSVVEQWFRMEIYLCLRNNGKDWSIPLVEGPYYTRLPARPSKKKLWNERPKWCDLVAIGPDSVHWMELKAIWYRKRTWKNNLYSSLRALLSLAAMDVDKTTSLWKEPTGDASSYEAFLEPFGKDLEGQIHNRYSICLLQAFPDELIDDESKDKSKERLGNVASGYLSRRTEKTETANPSRFGWAGEKDRGPALEACREALTVDPEVKRIGTTNRGSRFLEANPNGQLAIVVWKVP